ncbi:MAG: hypothetical protein IJF61_05795 [Clostridia bacterium]|nr:hypothetical protein [Clostridia bacterium]
MSFKKKLENFWYYHKTAVIIVIVCILLGSVFIQDLFQSIEPDLKVTLVSAGQLTEGNINFNNALSDNISDINNDGEANIAVSHLVLSESLQEDNDEAFMETLEAKLANKGATLFIVDKVNFDRMIKKDAFCPLNEFFDVAPYGDRVLYRGEQPMAFHLTGSKVLGEMGFVNDDLYAMLLFRRPGDEQDPTTVSEYENAVAVLTELMKQS